MGRTYSGKPTNEKLFEKGLRKYKVKEIVFERYSDYTKERECKDYKESKHKIKYEEIEAIRKETVYM
jgi:hypothetical protein